jgi:YHS domain-containing protein
VAAHGYDVVAYFNQNQPRRGSRNIKQRLGMATYYFASSRNRYQFLSDAPKYQPQFGGYCAMAMAVGRLEDINPEVFAIYRGKLYLFRDEGARAAFFRRPDHAIHGGHRQLLRDCPGPAGAVSLDWEYGGRADRKNSGGQGRPPHQKSGSKGWGSKAEDTCATRLPKGGRRFAFPPYALRTTHWF